MHLWIHGWRGARGLGTLAALILMAAVCGRARAQTDEIQVYDATIAAPGVFNLTLHDNFTFSGSASPAYPGGIAPEHALNGVPEWAYGVTRWFEAGLYLPLYSVESDGALVVNGAKLRALFVSPDAATKRFFYGINFEFSYNRPQWDPRRVTSEIRPIVGWRSGRVTFVINPILDNSFTGARNLDFAPSARLAYAASPRWTVAAEEYADFGPVHHFYSPRQQSHQLFGVIDYTGAPISIEFGIGAGLTSTSDQAVAKLILSKDIN
ncbi:MAG: hypothetical protein KGI55_02415 [Gammaproteobacteria bacterium]|nr:hypothetical protein [Gammaproteobacteria bacterium]